MKKVFYICDNYHTGVIANEILDAFPESTIFIDSIKISTKKDFLELAPAITAKKLIFGEEVSRDNSKKVDFFIVSARLIYDGSVNPKQLKSNYGKSGSKIIAVSMYDHYLGVKSSVDMIEEESTFMDSVLIKKFFS